MITVSDVIGAYFFRATKQTKIKNHPKQASNNSQFQPLVGIAYKVSSICLFVVMMISIKFLQDDVPIGQVIFARSLLGMFAVVLVYYIRGQLASSFVIRSVRTHTVWSVSAASAMGMWFVCITLIPLPEATAIGFIMPLLVVALAYFILKEKIRIIRWVAILSGLTGVGIIVWPRLGVGADYSSTASIGAALALSSALCWAFAQIALRRLTKTETSGSAVLSFSVTTMIMSLFSLPFGWVSPSVSEWGLIAICGIAGGFGQLCVAESLRFAEASALAPFEYLAFPVASIAAIFFFGEYPDANIWWGLPLIVAGGLLVIYREHQLSKRQKAD